MIFYFFWGGVAENFSARTESIPKCFQNFFCGADHILELCGPEKVKKMVQKRLILGQNRDFGRNLPILKNSAAIIGLVGAELAPNFF